MYAVMLMILLKKHLIKKGRTKNKKEEYDAKVDFNSLEKNLWSNDFQRRNVIFFLTQVFNILQ